MKRILFLATIAILFANLSIGQWIKPNKVGTYSTGEFSPTGNYIGVYFYTGATDTSGSINFINQDGGIYKLTAPSIANGTTTTDVIAGQNWTNTAVHDSGYYWQPIYGVGVFSAATTATVTTTAVTAKSVIAVGWYGSTVPAYSVTPSVPTTTIVAGTQFVVKSSVSTSDSFYYIIYGHN